MIRSPRERAIKRDVNVALVAIALTLFIGLFCGPSLAAETRNFNISAGPAEAAVLEFARQARMSVMYEPGSLDHFKTRAVRGAYEPIEALRLLLDDTGLDFIRTAKHLVDVRPNNNTGPPGPDITGIPTVEIVTPGVSNRSDLPPGVAVRTINADDLSRQGFTTVPDWVRSLTQNQGIGANEATGYYGVALSNVAYGSGLNLYGIGQRATLILVNGQRLAPSGTEGSFTDVSNIPLSAVDHIELISDGASTIYGADAAGGIVNFVLRGPYSRPSTALSLGQPGSLSEKDLSHSWSEHGEKWAVVAGFELYSRNALPSSERSQATSDLRPWGGDNFDGPYGNPGAILAKTGQLWIPSGQNGSHLTRADLLSFPREYDSYAGTWILPQQRRINALLNVSFDPSVDTQINFNALFNMRWVKSHVAPFSTALSVPDTNPFYVNPVAGDTSPVRVLYGFGSDLGGIVDLDTVRSGQATLGVKHKLSDAWSLEATAGYTYEYQLQDQTNLVNYDKLTSYLGLEDPARAFNPFGDGSNTNPQTLDAIRANGSNDVKSAFKIASLKAGGSMPLLPSGPLTIAAGYDFRLQTFLSNVSPAFSSVGPVFDTDRHRTLHAVYAQLSAPVLPAEFSSDASYNLNLAAGLRYERFDDAGGASLPSLGFLFKTKAGLSLFGNWARMFRPPNLPDLNESINTASVLPLADPNSPKGYTNALIWTGNNADLHSERARSWMVGINFSPPSEPGFSFDAQYFHILTLNQLLPTQIPPASLFSDSSYNYLYTRDVTLEAIRHICAHATFVGAAAECTSSDVGAIVDLRLRSAEAVMTDGIDMKALRRWATREGEMSANLQATYVLHFKQTQAPGDDFISYRNTPHYPTALRLRSVLRWENEWLSVSPALNFQSGYTDTISIPNRPVGSWSTWDLVVAYKASRLDSLVGGHSTVSLRGQNVFNKQPPFLNNNISFVGFDPENADLLGRRISLRLEYEW